MPPQNAIISVSLNIVYLGLIPITIMFYKIPGTYLSKALSSKALALLDQLLGFDLDIYYRGTYTLFNQRHKCKIWFISRD